VDNVILYYDEDRQKLKMLSSTLGHCDGIHHGEFM
jgi:hypothetical protein